MDLTQLITLAILATAILLFITEWLRVDIVAIGVVVSLMLTQILTTSEAIAGFSNSAVLTIAALFIVGGAVLNTGLAKLIGQRVLAIAGTGPVRLTFVLMLTVALLSSFLSDTGTVAVLLPAALVLAREAKLPPSKLLIPLSYGALLGGAMTLIGTTPNLIVSELLEENGFAPFGFFSFTPIGVILLIIGITFMLLIGHRLLPNRRTQRESQPVENPAALIERYRLPDNLFHLRVRLNSPLAGQKMFDTRFGQQFDLTCIEILRRTEPRRIDELFKNEYIPDKDRVLLIPEPNTIIEMDDILIVQGEMHNITRASNTWKLNMRTVAPTEGKNIINEEIGIAEVIIPPRSGMIGKTIVSLNFGARFHLNVVGLFSANGKKTLDIRDTPLRAGDILLVQGPWQNIHTLSIRRRDFLVLGSPAAMLDAPQRDKAGRALLILALMLGLMISGLLPVAAAAMLAGLLMVLAGCLTMDEAYQSVDWKSIVLIAGMLPMSTALQKVGLVGLAAESFTNILGDLGPLAVLAGLFLFTATFTQVLSNTATTVLVAPIALATAQTLGVQPYAFMLAVALAASTAFASPVASPTNTLVMGAGSYRFSDYMKTGLPLIALAMIAAVFILPLLFPF